MREMNKQKPVDGPAERPDCMVRLGLMPPYTVEDVMHAYRARAKTAHPDAGGDVADFVQLHEAFEQAKQYIEFRGNRLGWLSAMIAGYAAQEEVIEEIVRRGGRVDVEEVDWLHNSFGDDFAQVADKLVGVHLNDPSIGDETLEYLGSQRAVLKHVRDLDLSGSGISDDGIVQLKRLPVLRRLNLRKTRVSARGVSVLCELRSLTRLEIERTAAGWLQRRRLRRKHRDLEIILATPQDPTAAPPAASEADADRPSRQYTKADDDALRRRALAGQLHQRAAKRRRR